MRQKCGKKEGSLGMSRPAAVLISCVSLKQKKPCIAREMYVSPLFKKSLIYAQRTGLPIYILSAKYGLIPEDKIITPYDLTLNTMSKKELMAWALMVSDQIKNMIGGGALLVLAGSRYLSFTQLIDNKIIDPMNKLPIGKRLQWLTKSIAE